MELLGREQAQASVDAALADALAGRASRLAIVGEPGIGKSALLDWAEGRDVGVVVLRVTGTEPEAELGFAALLSLVRPLLRYAQGLPRVQRRALEGALDLGRADADQRFAVGAATLGVVAAAAEERPLALLLDDVQWFDRPSLDTIAFAVRRLEADAVCVLAGTRPEGLARLCAARFGVVSLQPLPDAAATALLGRVVPAVAPAVRDQILAAAHGNPLALVELPGRLTEAQLAGREPIRGDLTAGEAVQRAFAGSLATLPAPARTALLALAVSGETATTVDAAFRRLGVTTADLIPAETVGLVAVESGRTWFRHPLVRAAVIGAAPTQQLRLTHLAVAEALPEGELRSRHRAAAAAGPDEDVAGELELHALEARARAAPATASSLLLEAAELSPAAEAASRRRLAAAETAWLAGMSGVARALADAVVAEAAGERLLAEALHLRGQIAHQTEPASRATDLLLRATAHAQGLGADAVPILADAVSSCIYAGDVEAALEAAERLGAIARTDGGTEEFWRGLQLGTALMLNGRGAEGAPLIGRAIELVQTVDVLRDDPRHLGSAAMGPAWIDAPELGRALAEQAVARARELGALNSLPTSLKFRAWADFDLGRWDAALAGASEAASIAREIGQTSQLCANLGIVARVLAARGDEAGCRGAAYEAIELADALELSWHKTGLLGSLGLLELGCGRPDVGVDRLGEAVELLERTGNLSAAESPFADLVEALARAGRREEAVERLEQYDALVRAERRDVGLAWAARLHGMLAPAGAYERSFDDALELLGDREPFERARVHLCRGERLRRDGKRREARTRLRAASDAFERLGARPWVERCRRELAASGARLRTLDAGSRDELTPQELQVALQVARGQTNREIAQTLFLSPKTVEFHLTRIYRKLGLNARAELVERFGDQV